MDSWVSARKWYIRAIEEFVRKNFLFGENRIQRAQRLFLTHLLS
jgi:hypothetical protein